MSENITITSLIHHYGLLVIFLSALLDRIGLPLPSFPVLWLAGALSLSGDMPILLSAVAATTGALTGDAAWYATGLRFGRRALALLCKITLSPDSCVRRTETTYARLGPWTLLFAKFVPGLGCVSVALCGITRVALPVFVTVDAIGAAIYIGVPLVLGRVFHNATNAALATLLWLGEYSIALVVGAFVVYLAIRWVDRQMFIRRLKVDRISVTELARMIDDGRAPIIFDVRPAEVRFQDGMIPGAVAAHVSEPSALLEDYPLDAEIVTYCSCPNEASAAIAAMHLRRVGFKRIRPLLGGIEAWARAGQPVELHGSRPRTVPASAA